ncbi:GARP complex subunit Vps53 [Schizosaccharomyces octosporus yFS286]|uniref:GARP complex subunit Vps53 n=1 Tax=Schizosaccharomyces octosporus (strain yFS286) TaxID=483514 RepID=S9Q426_SCHOY|nr:GARP complex subunit Vps53 [Schizosaccharomyces octosporus yFS286]EPX74847.1 GARP complex subunit Vps53 [Schizosaccharomyces octosporus yFS286]
MSDEQAVPIILEKLHKDTFDHEDALRSLLPSTTSIEQLKSIRGNLVEQLNRSQDDLGSIKNGYNESNNNLLAQKNEFNVTVREVVGQLQCLHLTAEDTQSSIVQLTSEIKNLDVAKKNLTSSMTLLKRLQMLVTAYEKLRTLRQNRQIGEATSLMLAMLQLLQFFKNYRSVERIASLSRNITEFQRSFYEQVFENFQLQFKKANSIRGGFNAASVEGLHELCGFIDVNGPKCSNALKDWYCHHQLDGFFKVFRENEEAGLLENFSRRYDWFFKLLQTYDDQHALIFPAHWRMDIQLCVYFCNETKADLSKILKGKDISYPVFFTSIRQTLDFQNALKKRFSHVLNEHSLEGSIKTQTFQTFESLSNEFNPYYKVYIEHEAKQLETLFISFPSKDETSSEESNQILSSSMQLFQLYRKIMGHFLQFTRGPPLIGLKNLFANWLRRYIEIELLADLQSLSFSQYAVHLNTAEYIHRTTLELEKRFREVCHADLLEQMSFQKVIDNLLNCKSLLIKSCTKKFENSIKTSLEPFGKMDLRNLDTVGDQSNYVSNAIHEMKLNADEYLGTIEQNTLARNFCDRVCESFTRQFFYYIYTIKPISEIGAEQILLDLCSFKNFLLKLPSSKPDYTITDSYINHLTIFMGYIETLLKTLLTPSLPKEGIIQSYLFLIKDRSVSNFTIILDMKGVPKSEQSSYLQLFSSFVSKKNDLSDNSAIFLYLNPSTYTDLNIRSRLSLDLTPEASSRTLQSLGRLFTSKKKNG